MYHISKIFNQEIILNFFYAINKDWSLQDTINLVSLVISVIATIVIPIVIFKLNTENQQLQALYQKKYEFWLEFSKSFFIMQNTLSFLLQPGNLKYGIVYQCSKKEVINNLQKFIDRWDKFYDLVDGNQKIYLESTGINVLILQTLISAIANLIKIKNTPSSIKIKLLGVPVWRVKYFDNRERFDLFAFIPVWVRKSPMVRVNL